ncbi:MAG: ribosome silencing factor [Actinomycetaceae bacterium]|nr:ribosome silencing factor [Actinomycetaceae bacterium]
MELNESTRHLINVAAAAAADKLGINPVAILVGERLVYSDAFLIVSAESSRQVQAIVKAIIDEVEAAGGPRPRIEGREELAWVLMDFGDFVVHVQLDEQREFYALERLWADCPRLELAEVELAR